jgi:hypothetical protein
MIAATYVLQALGYLCIPVGLWGLATWGQR